MKSDLFKSGNSSHKYNVSTKITLSTHQALYEYANIHHNANISSSVRDLIEKALYQASKEDTSPGFKLATMRMERERKAQYQLQLQQDYISLQADFDPEFQEVLKEFAEDHGLAYPPDVTKVNIWDIDQNLNKTLHAVRVTCNGTGETTLREVQRQTGQPRDDVMRHLSRLRDLKQVTFEDVPSGKSCTITLT